MPTASIRVIREGQYWAADKLMDETLNGIEQMPRCCTTLGEAACQNCTKNYARQLTTNIRYYPGLIFVIFVST